ncbi:MAG: divalent metal cation transporter MntH [Bacillota bacterium]
MGFGTKQAWRKERSQPSLPEVYKSVCVPQHAPWWRKFLAFAGPGYLVAVGYMDPGNWAAALEGGSRFNYTLLSMIVISNIMAMVLQTIAGKLGIVTKRDLAQACRDHYSPTVSFLLWVLCEVAIAACDLAELIGSAIALKLLFGLPILYGIIITALDVLILLLLQQRGFRYIEAIVISLITLIGLCFAVEMFIVKPNLWNIAKSLVPSPDILLDKEMLYVAIAILGATVMPHNLYLHSSIVQTRKIKETVRGKLEAIRYNTWDTNIALFFALLINASILIMAAATFFKYGVVKELEDAFYLFQPLLGTTLASTLFATALLASGQNSTLTGTLAGQIVMEGFLNIKLKPWIRRLITRAIAIVPAIFIIHHYGESATGSMLMFSQIILSFQLPFAIIPLIQFTNDRKKMGDFVNCTLLKITSWSIAIIIIALNVYLTYTEFIK